MIDYIPSAASRTKRIANQIRCLAVFKDATSIGCDEEHVFCKSCLETQILDTCPQCRQSGLDQSKMRPVKVLDRMIKKLRARCSLQYDESQNEDEEEGDGEAEGDTKTHCEWTGDLGDLPHHIKHHCALSPMVCAHCKEPKKRYQMAEHDAVCPEKKIACAQGCS